MTRAAGGIHVIMIIVTIAAYNESKHIAQVVTDVRGFVDAVVVVDDGSKDDTAAQARAAGAHVFIHPINRGQGAALQTAMDAALRLGADVIVHFDADGQMLASEIPLMVESILSGRADVALGTRFANGKSNVPWMRRLVLTAGIVFTGLVSGLWLTDTHNGFRALSRNAASRMRITLDLFAHASEILDWVARLKLRYVEVPVTVRYTQESLAKGQKMSGSIRIVKDVLKAKLLH